MKCLSVSGQRYLHRLALFLFWPILVACVALGVGVEQPQPDYAATVSVLATENARLAERPTPTSGLGKLAYVQGGDIWVKALPDGEARRLTQDGRNSDPRWSPSGRWVAFHKGENKQVWVMQADGSNAHSLPAAPGSAFAWSPIDDRLAYADGDALAVAAPDGGEPAVLLAGLSVVPPASPPQGNRSIDGISWSPDGQWIVYAQSMGLPGQPITDQGLWKVPVNGGEPVEVYTSGMPERGEAILAGWTGDGRYVLFWQGEMMSASLLADGAPLYALPTEGGEPVRLADAVLAHADFVAPDGQAALVAITAGSYRATWTNKRVAVVEVDTNTTTFLTPEGQAAFSPSWSPDGAHIAYVAMPDRGDLVGGEEARRGMMQRRIWVVHPGKTVEPRQLTDDAAYRDERPLWSADGTHLLFARLDAEDRTSLWLLSLAEGGEPQQVMEGLTPAPEWFGYYGHVDWEPLYDWWRGW